MDKETGNWTRTIARMRAICFVVAILATAQAQSSIINAFKSLERAPGANDATHQAAITNSLVHAQPHTVAPLSSRSTGRLLTMRGGAKAARPRPRTTGPGPVQKVALTIFCIWLIDWVRGPM